MAPTLPNMLTYNGPDPPWQQPISVAPPAWVQLGREPTRDERIEITFEHIHMLQKECFEHYKRINEVSHEIIAILRCMRDDGEVSESEFNAYLDASWQVDGQASENTNLV